MFHGTKIPKVLYEALKWDSHTKAISLDIWGYFAITTKHAYITSEERILFIAAINVPRYS